MMSKFKRWLYNKFLPAYCKDELMETNERLSAVVTEQRHEIERLKAYIGGVERAMRYQKRITIHTGEVKP